MVWKALERVQRLDIRFSNAADESSFKKSVEGDLVRTFLIGCVIFSSGLLLNVPMSIRFFFSHKTYPFQWSYEDPRTQFVYARLFQGLIVGVFAMLLALRRYRGCFKDWNWELYSVAVIALVFVAAVLSMPWHVSTLYGMDPAYVWELDVSNTELQTCLAMDAALTTASLFIPFRSVILWVLPTSALIPLALVLCFVGSPFPADVQNILLIFGAISLISFSGAHRNEKIARAKWLTQSLLTEQESLVAQQQQELEQSEGIVQEQQAEIQGSLAMAASMGAVAESFCDIVVKLDRDFHVCGSDSKHRSFFNQEIAGQKFTNLLRQDDKMRFLTLATQAVASSIPGCLHFTLDVGQSIIEASMLLVYTNQSKVHYVLGISIQKTQIQTQIQTQIPDNDAATWDDMLPELPGSVFGSSEGKMPGEAPQAWEDDGKDEMASVATWKTTPSFIAANCASSLLDKGNIVALGLGNYKQVAILGAGSDGKVYHVTDDTGQVFALKKVLLRGKLWHHDFPRLLQATDREVRLLKAMCWASEVIVKLHECWVQSPGPYACIVLELMPKPLRGVLTECAQAGSGLAPVRDVRAWFVHMTCGIGAIHSVGWLHRDVKTDNMLLTDDLKRCKVADLGLARQLVHEDAPSEVGSSSCTDATSVMTGSSSVRGTQGYMSPEALAAEGGVRYGKPSDIYSLGCVLLEMLVGKDRFLSAAAKSGESSTDSLDRAAEATFEAIEKSNALGHGDNAIRTDLKNLCLQMLATNYRLRPAISMILAKECLREPVVELTQRAPSLQRVLSMGCDEQGWGSRSP